MSLSSQRFSTNQRLVSAAENNPALGKGERGEGIRLIQQGLIELGYPMPISTRKYASPDGIYGSEVKAKVRDFQSANGLGRDGTVGRNTMHKLDALLRTPAPLLPPLPRGTKTRIVHNVPMVAQGPNPICWVACAAMVMSFKQHRSVTVGEINNGFDPSNSSMTNPATSWPVFYDILSSLGFTSKGPRMSPSEDFLLDLVQWHGPFILTHYTSTLAPAITGVGTHAVVVTGLDMNADKCFYNSPWGTRNDSVSISTILGSMERLWQLGTRSVAYIP